MTEMALDLSAWAPAITNAALPVTDEAGVASVPSQAAEDCVCGFVELEQAKPSACVEWALAPVSLFSNMACRDLEAEWEGPLGFPPDPETGS